MRLIAWLLSGVLFVASSAFVLLLGSILYAGTTFLPEGPVWKALQLLAVGLAALSVVMLAQLRPHWRPVQVFRWAFLMVGVALALRIGLYVLAWAAMRVTSPPGDIACQAIGLIGASCVWPASGVTDAYMELEKAIFMNAVAAVALIGGFWLSPSSPTDLGHAPVRDDHETAQPSWSTTVRNTILLLALLALWTGGLLWTYLASA